MFQANRSGQDPAPRNYVFHSVVVKNSGLVKSVRECRMPIVMGLGISYYVLFFILFKSKSFFTSTLVPLFEMNGGLLLLLSSSFPMATYLAIFRTEKKRLISLSPLFISPNFYQHLYHQLHLSRYYLIIGINSATTQLQQRLSVCSFTNSSTATSSALTFCDFI